MGQSAEAARGRGERGARGRFDFTVNPLYGLSDSTPVTPHISCPHTNNQKLTYDAKAVKCIQIGSVICECAAAR